MNLSALQFIKFSQALLHLHIAAQPEEIPAAFMRAVRTLLDCEHLSYNEFGTDHFCGIVEPIIDPKLNQTFAHLAHQHPSIRHIQETGSVEAVRISDLRTPDQWHRTQLFNEFFRRLGIFHQLALLFPVGNLQIGFAANRGERDFSEADCFLLSQLQPHLFQAFLNAQALERTTRASDAQGGGTIVLSNDGRVLLCSPKAGRTVERFFGQAPRQQLPDELRRWVERGLAAKSFDVSSSRPLRPLVKEAETSILTVRLCPNFAIGEHILVIDEQPTELPLQVFEQFGHSKREAEVLSWIAQGKTNPEIAIILGISARTVAHHVERILARLGVEGRGSAGAWAQETMRTHRLNWNAEEDMALPRARR